MKNLISFLCVKFRLWRVCVPGVGVFSNFTINFLAKYTSNIIWSDLDLTYCFFNKCYVAEDIRV